MSCLSGSIQRLCTLYIAAVLCPLASGQILSAADAALATRIDRSPLLLLKEEPFPLHASIVGWTLGAVSGVAVGVDGNIYLVQRGPGADPIQVFDPNGNRLRSWGKGDFTLPHSLRLDAHGNVWTIDAGASKVIEYTSTGNKLLTISLEPVPETGSSFRGATDLAFAPNGHVFITDGYGNARVLEYTADGRKIREWGHPGTGPGAFHLPHAIQIGPTGTVYVADRENGRIEVFSPHGRFLRAFDGLGKCYALELRSGALWVTMGPKDQDPGTPGWLAKLDPKNGRMLGHLFVPEQRAGHALALLASGEPLETAGSVLLLFTHAGEDSPPR